MPIRRCTCDIKVDVHEKRIPDVHGPDSASCWRPCVCGAVAGAGVTNGRLRPWTGATPVFGMPHTARRRLGCARQSHPRLGSLPVQQSLAGRPSSPRLWAVAKPKRWSQRNRRGEGAARSPLDREGFSGEWRSDGGARRSDKRVDGERLLRRLEAALHPFPEGSLVRERPLEAGGASCENTLGPTPHRALGEGGRSSHGTCRRCATAHPAAVPPRRCRACG